MFKVQVPNLNVQTLGSVDTERWFIAGVGMPVAPNCLLRSRGTCWRHRRCHVSPNPPTALRGTVPVRTNIVASTLISALVPFAAR